MKKYTENDIKGLIEHPTANHFKYLFNNSPLALAYVSPSGRYIKVNHAFCKLLEYSATELLSKKIEDITHPEDLYFHLEEIKKLERGDNESFFIIKKYISKTGKVIPCLITQSRIDDEEKDLLHYVIYVTPIQNGTLAKLKEFMNAKNNNNEKFSFKEKVILWIINNWKTSLAISIFIVTTIFYMMQIQENINQLITLETQLIEIMKK